MRNFEMLKFVINLSRAQNRWVHMQRELGRLGIQAQRVEAIDGRLLSPASVASLTAPLTDISKISCPRELSLGEIGAFLSHRECWKLLLDSDETWALIMEDDLGFSDRAKHYLCSSDWIPKGLDLIQVFLLKKQWQAVVDKRPIRLSSGDCLWHPYKPSPVGSQAYFISKNAARLALSLSSKIMAPVDEFLFNPISDFARQFPVYRLNPSIVIPLDEELPSTIAVNTEDYQYSKRIQNHPIRKFRKLQVRLKRLIFGKKEMFIFR